MSRCYDRLAVFKTFSRVFCFEQVDALIDFWDELYSSEISKDENREQRLKEPFVITKMLKLTQNLEQLAVRGKFVVFFLFSVHCIKQTYSMLQWVCSSVTDHRRRQNVVKNISDSLVYGSCATSLFLSLWSITEQTHGNMESICKGYHKVRWLLQSCYSTHPKLLHAWCYILLKNAETEFRTWKRMLEK